MVNVYSHRYHTVLPPMNSQQRRYNTELFYKRMTQDKMAVHFNNLYLDYRCIPFWSWKEG